MAISSISAAEANIATFQRAIEEGWNRGDVEAIDELFAPDFVEHQPGIAPGREGVKGSIRALRAARTSTSPLRTRLPPATGSGCAFAARARTKGPSWACPGPDERSTSPSSISSAWSMASWSSTGASRIASASPSRSGSFRAGHADPRPCWSDQSRAGLHIVAMTCPSRGTANDPIARKPRRS